LPKYFSRPNVSLARFSTALLIRAPDQFNWRCAAYGDGRTRWISLRSIARSLDNPAPPATSCCTARVHSVSCFVVFNEEPKDCLKRPLGRIRTYDVHVLFSTKWPFSLLISLYDHSTSHDHSRSLNPAFSMAH
jgi:hypothetical protein